MPTPPPAAPKRPAANLATSALGEDPGAPASALERKAVGRGVVAARADGTGVVLWAAGCLEDEIAVVGAELSDLGLDDAPVGIWIWEGCYVWQPGGFENPDDGSSWPSGAFRAPTEVEWAAIRAGTSPFADSGASGASGA